MVKNNIPPYKSNFSANFSAVFDASFAFEQPETGKPQQVFPSFFAALVLDTAVAFVQVFSDLATQAFGAVLQAGCAATLHVLTALASQDFEPARHKMQVPSAKTQHAADWADTLVMAKKPMNANNKLNFFID